MLLLGFATGDLLPVSLARYRRLIACFFGPLQETIASFYGPYRLTFSAKSSILELNYGFSEHERKNGGDVFPKSMI